MSLTQRDATRFVNVIDSRIDKAIGRGTVLEVTYGDVQAVSGRTAAVYIGGDTNASDGFRVPGWMTVNVGDRVRVSIDARGYRRIEEVLPTTTGPKLSWDVENGKLLWGDGTVEPTDVSLYRSGAGILRADGQLQATSFKAPSVPTTGDVAVSVQTSGHSTQDFYIYGDGKHTWGDGSNAHDLSVYREATHPWLEVVSTGEAALRLRGADANAVGFYGKKASDGTYRFYIADGVGGAGKSGIMLGDGTLADTNLYRDSADLLKTDDSLYVGGYIRGGNASTTAYDNLSWSQAMSANTWYTMSAPLVSFTPSYVGQKWLVLGMFSLRTTAAGVILAALRVDSDSSGTAISYLAIQQNYADGTASNSFRTFSPWAIWTADRTSTVWLRGAAQVGTAGTVTAYSGQPYANHVAAIALPN